MRTKHIHTFTCSVALTAMLSWAAGPVNATVMAKHVGASDPLNQGWTTNDPTNNHPVNSTGTAVPNDGGVAAWNINTLDGSRVRYGTPVNAGVDGWKMSVVLKVEEIPDTPLDFDTMVEVYDFRNEILGSAVLDHVYAMRFGSNSQGNALVNLWGKSSSHVISPGYHLFEMVFRRDADRPGLPNISASEGDGAVALYVDGVLFQDNYLGEHTTPTHHRPQEDYVQFGNFFGTQGNANYNLVMFQTEAIPTPRGDANLDLQVEDADLSILLTNFGSTSAAWTGGDFNGDGLVEDADLSSLLTNFGGQFTNTGLSTNVAVIPEPASLALLITGGLLLVSRRRRMVG